MNVIKVPSTSNALQFYDLFMVGLRCRWWHRWKLIQEESKIYQGLPVCWAQGLSTACDIHCPQLWGKKSTPNIRWRQSEINKWPSSQCTTGIRERTLCFLWLPSLAFPNSASSLPSCPQVCTWPGLSSSSLSLWSQGVTRGHGGLDHQLTSELEPSHIGGSTLLPVLVEVEILYSSFPQWETICKDVAHRQQGAIETILADYHAEPIKPFMVLKKYILGIIALECCVIFYL